MARRAKADTIAADAAPKETAEERFERLWPDIRDAKIELDKCQTAASSANGVYRKRLQSYKKAGGDMDALLDALRLQKLDPEDVDKRVAGINWALRMLGVPVGHQLGLFEDGRDIASKVDEDKLREAGVVKDGAAKKDDDFEKPHMTTEAMILAAKTAGFNAGSTNKPLLANPYPAESPEGLAWSGGYKDAQHAIAARMGGRGKRGAGEAQPTA